MNKLKLKALSAISAATLTLAAFAPAAFANTTLLISGNGSRSDNTISVDTSKSIDITQSNDADFDNNVRVSANTGDNSLEDNTGGDNSIETGDVDTDIEIANIAGHNVLDLGGLCGCEEELDAIISGNGYRSDNSIDVDQDAQLTVRQDNDSDIDNNVRVDANTGDNESEGNTGSSYGSAYHNYNGDYDHKDNYTPKHDYHNYDNYNNDCGCMSSHDNYGSHINSDHHKVWFKNAYMNNWWDNDNDWWNNHYNNGGESNITTGDVMTHLMITNLANSNMLSL